MDDRAIMVYLSLRYPEKYYLYKYTMFKDFVERTDYDDSPKSGDFENLFKFESLCKYIHNYIMHDAELLEMYEPHEFSQKVICNPTELKGEFVDYAEREKKLKQIGDLGEQFIFSQEREKVKQYKLPRSKKVTWVSRDKGDGLGFDILSYDEKGKEMYIEVKTTTLDENASFYISANELEKSKLYADNYYLYRVYQFDMKTAQGQYSIRKGSLEDLCLVPQTYRVDFKENMFVYKEE